MNFCSTGIILILILTRVGFGAEKSLRDWILELDAPAFAERQATKKAIKAYLETNEENHTAGERLLREVLGKTESVEVRETLENILEASGPSLTRVPGMISEESVVRLLANEMNAITAALKLQKENIAVDPKTKEFLLTKSNGQAIEVVVRSALKNLVPAYQSEPMVHTSVGKNSRDAWCLQTYLLDPENGDSMLSVWVHLYSAKEIRFACQALDREFGSLVMPKHWAGSNRRVQFVFWNLVELPFQPQIHVVIAKRAFETTIERLDKESIQRKAPISASLKNAKRAVENPKSVWHPIFDGAGTDKAGRKSEDYWFPVSAVQP